MRVALASSNPSWRVCGLVLLTLGACVLPAAPAVATSAHAPEYSLSIVEGASTRPEESILSTSAGARHAPQVILSIVRGGLVIERKTGGEGVWLQQAPQVGDLVSVESQPGQVVGSVVYDGLPSLDPTVCAGSVSFSGQRSAADTVEGGYYSFGSHTDPYGHTSWFKTGNGQAQVTLLSGSVFAGNFLTPLAVGQTVWASESLQTPLAGGATFTYSSENDRPVGACPVPPPPPVPPAPPALQGTILKLIRITVHKLLRSGLVDQVTINQPGTVIQDLYLKGGTLPAFASKAKRHRHKPAAMLLARGSAVATAGGTLTVHLHLTSRGRKRLKHARNVKAVLVTTLIAKTGKLSLGDRTISLR